MADKAVAAVRDPVRDREQVYEDSLRFIQEHTPSEDPGHGWRDTIAEIEEEYNYRPAYDVAFALAHTLYLAPMVKPRPEDLETIAAAEKRHARLMRLLAQLETEMAAEDPVAEGIFLVEGPQADWQFLKPQGKLADWHLDEFTGQIGVILGQTRQSQALTVPPGGRGHPVHLDPCTVALSFGVQLLRMTGVLAREIDGQKINPDKQRDDLRQRFWRLRREARLPPPPDDADPRGWAEAIHEHLQRQLWNPEGRYFVTPRDALSLPIRVDTWSLRPGSALEQRGPRWLHPPIETQRSPLEQLCRVLPKHLHAVAFVSIEAMGILRPWLELSGISLEELHGTVSEASKRLRPADTPSDLPN